MNKESDMTVAFADAEEAKLYEEAVEMLQMNVDNSCDFICENCERYFECTLPERYELKERGRSDIVARNMAQIKRKILIMGGKGGVGKTTTAVNLSAGLAMKGRSVCIIDSDFDSPSVPKMLGIKGQKVKISTKGILPVASPYGVKVMSTGFLLQDADVITWYHDMRRGATEEFCANVYYGKLDYLIVDLPPGTGTDSISMMQMIPNIDGAIIVTIAAEVSQSTARRCIMLCRKAGIEVLGVVENMGGYNCPKCGENLHVMQFGGGEKLAKEQGVRFLGRVPLHQEVSSGAEEGVPFIVRPDSKSAPVFMKIVDQVEAVVLNKLPVHIPVFQPR